MMKNTPFKLAIGAALLIVPSLSYSATLVDSISGSPGTTEGFIDTGKALGFRTGASDYVLEAAQVTFRHNFGGGTPDITAAIYSSTASGDLKPVTSLGNFTIPTITTGQTGNYTLTLETPLTLSADTNYFFVMYSSTSNVIWMYTASAPTSDAGYTFPDVSSATGNQYGWFGNSGNFNDPASWTGGSGAYNDLILTGTIIPEPSSLALVFPLGAFGLVRRRR